MYGVQGLEGIFQGVMRLRQGCCQTIVREVEETLVQGILGRFQTCLDAGPGIVLCHGLEMPSIRIETVPLHSAGQV